jgi:hypothetical protein
VTTPRIAFGACSYPEEHKSRHEPHPVMGGLVCMVCHPVGVAAEPREGGGYAPQAAGNTRRIA